MLPSTTPARGLAVSLFFAATLFAGALATSWGCRSAESGPVASVEHPSNDHHRSFTFRYRAATENVPADAASVRLWIPIPIDDRNQRIEGIRIAGRAGSMRFEYATAEIDSVIEKDGVRLTLESHPIEGGHGRSLCATSNGVPIELVIESDVLRYVSSPGGDAEEAELRDYLAPDSMIPLDGKVAVVAASLPTSDSATATGEALFAHTLDRMRYDKPEGEGWGRGDAEWACDSGFGNCTDFHSYFMGLARAKGIPVRFVMGFSIPGGDEVRAEIGGYHCWAEFWDDEAGWVPVDISEADKHPELANEYFGRLDYDRLAMVEGRDVSLRPATTGGSLNFFIYPYAEVDGKEWRQLRKSLSRTNR